MTANQIADLLHARPAGRNRWLANCPSHADRHPSLAISQGHSGILLRCWSHGCTPESICAALSLRVADLFNDRDLTLQQRAEAAQRSKERDAERRAQHHAGVEHGRKLLRLENLADALGAKLVRNPDDRELGRLFHLTCERLHQVEANLPHHEDGPLRLPAPSAVPGWIHDVLLELGQNFDVKEKAASQAACELEIRP